MRNVNLSQVPASDFSAVEAIANEAGVDFLDCYQCGKCTAGCPMAHGMDLMPREVIRLLQLGLVDEALRAKTPWICAQCSVCSARCPQNVDIAAIMRAVRHASKDAGYKPVRESDLFDDLFIDGVRNHGRSNEQYLAAKYNIASGHLLQDMGNAPKMMERGMVGMDMQNVENRKAVRNIVDKVLENGSSMDPEIFEEIGARARLGARKVEEIEAAIAVKSGKPATVRLGAAIDEPIPNVQGKATQWASNAVASAKTAPQVVRSGLEVDPVAAFASLSQDKTAQKIAGAGAGIAVGKLILKRIIKRKGR